MQGSRRIDGFVARARREEPRSKPPAQAPTWAVIALGVLLVVGLGFVVVSGHPALYGFVAAMVAAGVFERMLDARTPSWGEGHVIANVDSEGVTFPSYRGPVALGVAFLAALLVAAACFIVVLSAPGLDLPMWFGGFALVLVGGAVYAVRLIARSVRRVDLRLDRDGVTAVRSLGASTEVPWGSLVTAFSAGRAILLATVDSTELLPMDHLRADPMAVAVIIDRCTALESHDQGSIVAVIEEMLVAPSSR
ncbi:hypothetical protein AB0O14_14295 [Microbacterium foliorum]